jgi:tight adherence protein B
LLIQVVLITFAAAFLLVLTGYLWYVAIKESPKAELKRRLRQLAKNGRPGGMPEELRSEILKETPPFDKFLSRIPFLKDLEKKLDQAGLKITTARFLSVVAMVAGVLFLLCLVLTKQILAALAVFAVFLILPFLYIEYKKRKRVERFTEQFPEALTMIARSLRAGHSFSSAVQLVGQEIVDPVGGLFKTAYDQQLLGLRMNDALLNMNERIDSLDLRFFTTAVGINTEVGGNLAEILDKLAETIRERQRIRRQVRVYTAQGRMSGYILAFLPVIAFMIFRFMLPGYETDMLNSSKGQIVMVIAVILQVIGFFVIRRIINIRI